MRSYIPMVGELPTRITKQRLEEIINNGFEENHRDELIAGHMEYALGIASTFAGQFYRLRDDFKGEAFCTLTICADRIVKKEYRINDVDHVAKYIGASISARCRDLVRKQRTLNMPERTLRWQIKNGLNVNGEVHYKALKLTNEKLALVKLLPLMYQEEFIDDDKINEKEVKSKLRELAKIPKVELIQEDEQDEEEDAKPMKGWKFSVPIAKVTIPSLDFIELVKKSIRNPMQDAILELKSEGFTLKEIGEKVGLSHVMVQRHVAQIEETFNKVNQEGWKNKS